MAGWRVRRWLLFAAGAIGAVLVVGWLSRGPALTWQPLPVRGSLVGVAVLAAIALGTVIIRVELTKLAGIAAVSAGAFVAHAWARGALHAVDDTVGLFAATFLIVAGGGAALLLLLWGIWWLRLRLGA